MQLPLGIKIKKRIAKRKKNIIQNINPPSSFFWPGCHLFQVLKNHCSCKPITRFFYLKEEKILVRSHWNNETCVPNYQIKHIKVPDQRHLFP